MVGKCEVSVASIRLGVNKVLIMTGTWWKKLKDFKKDFLYVLGSTCSWVYYLQAELGSDFSKTKYFFSGRQAFASSTNMATSGLRKMLFFAKSNT